MRDITLVMLLLTLAWMAWRQPWVGVLALVFVGVMHPQGYVTGFMQNFPAYFFLLVVVALSAGWQVIRQRTLPTLFWDWRLAGLVLLWGQMTLTTALGINPWAGWPRLLDVTKILPLVLLIQVLIDTRMKLTWLLRTVGASLAVVMLKGGYWAFITGFHDRVYGPPGSQYGGNNEFAVATAMAIPLLALWYRETESRAMRWILACLIVLGFMSALSSWSRGGLLSISAVALLLVWHSHRRWLALPLLLGGVGLVFVGLPDEWFARMQTMTLPSQEESAATRLELWLLGWDYALQHPWIGGGFGSWIYLSLPVGGSRAWHSAYIEIAVEHGFAGLVFWAGLVLGSVVSLTLFLARNQTRELPGLRNQAAMLSVSLIAYLVGAAFLSIAYWELLFLLLASAMLHARFVREARAVQAV